MLTLLKIVTILYFVFCGVYITYLAFKKRTNKSNEIVCSPSLRIIMTLCTLLPTAGLYSNIKGYLTTFNKEYFDYFIVPGILVLSFWVLLYITNNWKISYDDNTLYYRNCFGVSKEYPFSETRIKTKYTCVEIYCGTKKITNYVMLTSITPEATEFEKKVMENSKVK